MKHNKNEKPPILNLLKNYIPIEDCGYPIDDIKNLINKNIVDYAEFKKPNNKLRTIHVNKLDIEKYYKGVKTDVK